MSFFSKGLALAASLILMAGGVLAEDAPETVDGATTVTVEEALVLFDEGAVFVDVRKPSDYDAGRIAGAIHLDVTDGLTEASLAEVAGKDDSVVFYCNGVTCRRSSKACAMAVGWGYSKVYYMRDGYPVWEVAGYMVE